VEAVRDVPLMLQELAERIVEKRLEGAPAAELAELLAEYEDVRRGM
jgi:hypothetical protein